MKKLLYVAIMILMISFVSAADNPDVDYDASGHKHLVYEESGNIYYALDQGTPELVAAGSAPAIAVDSSGNPHIVYVSSGIKYLTKSSDWQTPVAIDDGSYPDIAASDNMGITITYKKGSSSGDIMVASSPNFEPSVFIDGYGYFQDYNYYYSPNVVSDENYYYISYRHYYNDGYDRYNYVGVKRSDGSNKMTFIDWGSNPISFGKQPITVIEGIVHLVYSVDGVMTWTRTDMSDWNSVTFGTGAQASIDGVDEDFVFSYVEGGTVYFRTSEDELAHEFLAGNGAKPVVAADDVCIYYVYDGSIMSTCQEAEEPCTDLDEDGVCAEDDCDDTQNDRWRVDYFYLDNDGDSFHAFGLPNMNEEDQIAVCYGTDIPEHYMEQTLGQDCNDNDYDPENDCSEPCTDEDQDGYCAEEDCNDNNPDSWRTDSYWVDYDEDGYHLFGLPNMDEEDRINICYGEEIPYPYVAQTLGRDCNDDDGSIYEGCGDQGGDDPVDVPEFGLIGAGLVLMGALVVAFKRR